MTRLFARLTAAVMISALSSVAWAAQKSSWDGIWSGAWGGSRPTSITIAANKVVSYDYGGATTPVTSSHVTASRVTYGENGVSIVLTRTGKSTASAKLHSDQGDATAELTRQ